VVRVATWCVTVLVGSVLATPAYAAPARQATAPDRPSVNAVARPATVLAGERVVVKGRVRHAGPRARVRLVVRDADRWQRVAVTRATRTGRYRFTVVPPRGDSTYRVLLPRREGHPAARSRRVSVRATWSPAVVVSGAVHRVDPAGAVTTTASGAAADVAGQRLVRERRLLDGSWAAIGEVVVGADGTWSDAFASAHDWQVRWTAPAAGARLAASSGGVVVDGSWTPTVVLSGTTLTRGADDRPSVTATGTSTGLAGATLVRERRLADGAWAAVGTAPAVPVGADGSWADTFGADPGWEVRWTAPALGARRTASTATVTVAPLEPDPDPDPDAGRRVALDTAFTVDFAVGQGVVDLVVDLDAGQRWTWVGPQSVDVTAISPSGQQVPVSWDADTHTATEAGDHVLRVTREDTWATGSAAVTLSTPSVVDGAVDDPATDLVSALTGQIVELTFAGSAGEVVSEYADPAEGDILPRSTPMLLAPSGATVPRFGKHVRQGHVWRLPETGTYTLRFTPPTDDVVDRPDQVVLSARLADVALDDPDRVSLEQPGRVALVRTTVPAGLSVTFSDDGPAHLTEELFGPDGTLIDTYTTSPTISPTLAGTYTQLVSYDYGAAEVDYFASAPGTLLAEVDGPLVAYDMGGIPDASTLVRVPVLADQVFSAEVLDSAGELCADQHIGFADNTPLWNMVSPNAHRGDHPPVLWTYLDGDLVMSINPCDDTGSIRLVPAVVAPVTELPPVELDGGGTLSAAEVPIEVTKPGQVTVALWGDGPTFGNGRLDGFIDDSTFAADTLFHVGLSRGDASQDGSSWSTDGHAGTKDDFWLEVFQFSGQRTYFTYAGPTATGTATLRLEESDW
jgi:hypothetical protein